MRRRDAAGWAALGAGVSAGCILLVVPLLSSAPPVPPARERADAAPSAGARDGEVRVELAEQRRIGLTIARAVPATVPPRGQGFARGLDGANLAAIDAEIVTASAAAAASRAEAARLALLASQDQSASARSVQAARAQAAADIARVQLASRRIGLEYGPGLAGISSGARRALVADMASGHAALVRIDMPGASIDQLRAVRIDGGSFHILGPAAAADPRLQSAGLLAILRGPVAASATNGRILGVTVQQGGSQAGTLVPRDAVMRWHGGAWVYRRTGAETFERVELADGRPVAGGWFVPAGIKAGDAIVVRGAGTLLAIDRGGGAAAGED